MRKARTEALKRHARAVDAIFTAQAKGISGTSDQLRDLAESRASFEEVRPDGWRDAEAAYAKDPTLAREAGSGQANRAIRALQLETQLRTSPERRAAQFVERWQHLDLTSLSHYRSGTMSDYRATRAEMGEMAKSLQCDSQLGIRPCQPQGRTGYSDGFGPPTRCGVGLLSRHRHHPGARTRALTPVRSATHSTPCCDDGPDGLAPTTRGVLSGSRTSSRRQ